MEKCRNVVQTSEDLQKTESIKARTGSQSVMSFNMLPPIQDPQCVTKEQVHTHLLSNREWRHSPPPTHKPMMSMPGFLSDHSLPVQRICPNSSNEYSSLKFSNRNQISHNIHVQQQQYNSTNLEQHSQPVNQSYYCRRIPQEHNVLPPLAYSHEHSWQQQHPQQQQHHHFAMIDERYTSPCSPVPVPSSSLVNESMLRSQQQIAPNHNNNNILRVESTNSPDINQKNGINKSEDPYYCNVRIVNGRFDKIGNCWLDEGQKKIHILVETNIHRSHVQKCVVYCEKETTNKRTMIFSLPYREKGEKVATSCKKRKRKDTESNENLKAEEDLVNTVNEESVLSGNNSVNDFEFYEGSWKFIYRCQKGFPVKSGITHSPLRFVAVISLHPNYMHSYMSNVKSQSLTISENGQLTFFSKQFFMYSKLPETIRTRKQKTRGDLNSNLIDHDASSNGEDTPDYISQANLIESTETNVKEELLNVDQLSINNVPNSTVVHILKQHSLLFKDLQDSMKNFQEQINQLASMNYYRFYTNLLSDQDTIEKIHNFLLAQSHFVVPIECKTDVPDKQRPKTTLDSAPLSIKTYFMINEQYLPVSPSTSFNGILHLNVEKQLLHLQIKPQSKDQVANVYWFCVVVDPTKKQVRAVPVRNSNMLTEPQSPMVHSIYEFSIDIAPKYLEILNEQNPAKLKLIILSEKDFSHLCWNEQEKSQLILLKFFSISSELFASSQSQKSSDYSIWSVHTMPVVLCSKMENFQFYLEKSV
jgi:hypothetical protein